ncbi:MAG: type II secretion system F family protein [Candidatus Schekmanbacteria bacterium]|nr:type II secretion system F family protein [Candidatus Schekmanbacteria bacterium]
MPVYAYRATDTAGKIRTGTLEARTQRLVIDRLQSQSLYPLEVKEQAEKSAMSLEISPRRLIRERVRQADIMDFTNQLATLLNAGLPLDRSLSILASLQEKHAMKDIISQILKTVQGGASMAEALAKHPKLFGRLYVNMVRAGEQGGVIELVLDRLAVFMEVSKERRDYVVSALTYPLILTGVAGISVAFLMIFVIPRFESILQQTGRELPASTAFLMAVSKLVQGYWWLLAGLIGFAIYSFRRYRDTEEGRLKIDGLVLRSPLFGDLVQKLEVSRFAQTLSTLLSSGVPLLSALSIVKETLQNRVIADSLIAAYGEIREGGHIAEALEESKTFPALAIHMIRVGEETGQLEQMLKKVADRYEKYIQSTVKRLISLLEPALILSMGLVVGFIVASLLMAMMQAQDISF